MLGVRKVGSLGRPDLPCAARSNKGSDMAMKRQGSIVKGIGATMFGMFLVASCSRGTEPNAAPSTQAPSPQASEVFILSASDCLELTCQGPLELGAYRSTILDPTIEFEISTLGGLGTTRRAASGFSPTRPTRTSTPPTGSISCVTRPSRR